ncbi:FxsA family protein [Actinomadura kijaniata]|uniref:FxsA family protein n=1 Tax=Actinomadura kijaniata TaxID=46161 RepID=UPI0009FBFBD8|nr:FxsA family protein [Actinomadura kijaniata]
MLPLVMVLAFLLMPILEIYVIIQVGQVIGGWWTVALLLVESLLGGWIVRREGRRAWNALKETFGRGAMPDRELADAALVLVGGVLLLTPGFVTDLFGFLFVLPFTRPLVRRTLLAYGARRMKAAQARGPLFPPGAGAAGSPFEVFDPFGGRPADARQPRGPVVQGEVLRDDDRPAAP